MSTEFLECWMETASGRKFFPFDPRPQDIDIGDIAISLANQCRFGGMMVPFYSVAQHCLHVSSMLPPEFVVRGLLHDAAEAYIVDLPTPLKNCLPKYKEIEDQILVAIAAHFGQSPEWLTDLPAEVQHADKVALVTERRDLKGFSKLDWGIDVTPHQQKLVPMSAPEARAAFLSKARMLKLL
jgi:hypothetical protein